MHWHMNIHIQSTYGQYQAIPQGSFCFLSFAIQDCLFHTTVYYFKKVKILSKAPHVELLSCLIGQ